MIPYARQDVDDADIRAVVEVLNSDWLTQGPAIERFEQSVADYCGVKYAVATCNATAALHLSCLSLGLKPGGLLWTSPNTFVASANCARYCGADVDFVDIDPLTFNMSVTELEDKLRVARRQKRLPDVVVPVHFGGQSCAMERIGELAREYGFAVVEDASHAIGGEYRGGRVGACTYSDLTVFSFHPVKIITSGEGGMILTNREDLQQMARLLRSHGITRDTATMMGPPDGAWYYEQIELGFNYRMSDIQAALGASQMLRIDEFVARRRHLSARYGELLKDVPVTLPALEAGALSAWHLYVIRVNPGNRSHSEVFDGLRARGVNVNLHYIPVHLQPYYRKLGFKPRDFPVAEQYYREAISLPLYYGLTDAAQDLVVGALKEILE
ncbi:MAG: UDP-4-amino-4,6-dideoxy-N-acetyl-beta-L-altrosamine transaminase [Sulfuricella sp.]|nr:UDP-4-amino-4,6-dideoxy-N-acetyl-beta-L-altrosamine transaminase [Sulfuricella sp.]